MTKKKDIWICILVPILLSLMLFLSGETQWAIFSLALIPLFFICWGLSILLSGRRLREVEKHMTEEERQQFNQLAKTYGKKVALFFAIPVAATYFILSDIIGVKNYRNREGQAIVIKYFFLLRVLQPILAPRIIRTSMTANNILFLNQQEKQF